MRRALRTFSVRDKFSLTFELRRQIFDLALMSINQLCFFSLSHFLKIRKSLLLLLGLGLVPLLQVLHEFFVPVCCDRK